MTATIIRSLTFTALTLAAVSVGAQSGAAQNYPVKPIRWVLSFGAPGGAPDTIARMIGPKLTEVWGPQVVVDPRAGAGGTIATDIVARSAPDGYTLLLASPSHAINTTLYGKLPYDTLADFTPVTLVAELPNILTVHPSLPVRSVKQLIALATAKPGALNFGSAGSGSSQHLAGELFNQMAGVRMVHIPYKGGGAVMIDLIAGQVQVTFGSATTLPHVRSGKAVALAVTTAKRASTLPELPTIAESGLPGYEASAWYIVLAPAKTPPAIVDKLHAEIVRAMKLPDVRERFNFQTIEPVGLPPAESAAYLAREVAKWAAVVKVSGAKVD